MLGRSLESRPLLSNSRSAGCIASPARAGDAIHPALREREGSGFETSSDQRRFDRVKRSAITDHSCTLTPNLDSPDLSW